MPIKIDAKGQGLVETILAVAVSVIVVTSLVSLAVFALRNSRQASYATSATQIAQTQIELIRAYRDYNSPTSSITWADFTGLIATCDFSRINPNNTDGRCFVKQGDTSANFPIILTGHDISKQPFTAYFGLACVSGLGTCNSTGGTVRAYVFVTWNVGGKSQSIYNVTDFTNWRLK